jgi:hypothetical protein
MHFTMTKNNPIIINQPEAQPNRLERSGKKSKA